MRSLTLSTTTLPKRISRPSSRRWLNAKWKKIEIEGDRPTKQTKRGMLYVFPDDRRRRRGGRGNFARGRLGMLTFTFCACVSYSVRFPGLTVPTLLVVTVQFSSDSTATQAIRGKERTDSGQILKAITILALHKVPDQISGSRCKVKLSTKTQIPF